MGYFSLLPDAISQAVTAPLLVVMPVYNEAANLRNVMGEWLPALDRAGADAQILVINDGSTDGTRQELLALAAQPESRLLVVDKLNSGHGLSCRLGYEIACRSRCEWVLQVDSDGQCDPVYFPEFWSRRRDNDFVLGLRTRRGDGPARAFTSKVCRFASSLVVGLNLKDPNVPYRLMRREALAGVLPMVPSSFNIHNVALTYVIHCLGRFRVARVPIAFKARAGGENSLNVPKVMFWGAAMLLELIQLRRQLRERDRLRRAP